MTVHIAPRSSWGARYQDGDLDLFGLAEEIAVHHSAVAALPADVDPAEERAAMRALESIGQTRFGTGISYNVVIFPSGRAYRGVSWFRRGTHTGGHNSTVRSICFAGNFETDRPTPAAIATAAAIVAEGRSTLWRASAPVKGHRDWKQTACPGRHLYPLLPVIAAGPTTTTEDNMPTAQEIAKAVWDYEIPVPPQLRDELGDEPRAARLVLNSALVRAENAENIAREARAAAGRAETLARQNRTKATRIEGAVDDLKET